MFESAVLGNIDAMDFEISSVSAVAKRTLTPSISFEPLSNFTNLTFAILRPTFVCDIEKELGP